MRQFFRNLPARSYEGPFLWKLALAIIALGIAVGFTFNVLAPDDPNDLVRQMIEEIGPIPEILPAPPHEPHAESKLQAKANTEDEVAEILMRLANAQDYGRPSPQANNMLYEAQLTTDQAEIARLMLASIAAGGEPLPGLVALTAENPPPPYSHFALGLYWLAREYPFHAARSFELEDGRHSNETARTLAVSYYTLAEAKGDLLRLLDNPDYGELLEPQRNDLLYLKAVNEGDWPGIFKQTVIYQYTGRSWQIVLIALLTGAAWFAFLMHAGRLWRAPGDIALCVAAMVLGALSTTATLMMITLQEEFWGFEEKYDLLGGLLYCIAGIGLREEALKLLFFTPLIPFLLRRKDALLALVVAGCVGLGFATEENVSYFHGSMGISGPGRFLTANFLHISATALTGYALYRAFLTGWKGADYAASVFGMVVFAHGLYDAFLMLPALMPYGLFAFTIYVLLCYQMFSVLDEVRPTQRQKLSLSFVFTAALSVVLAVCLGWAVSMVGFSGIRLIGMELVSVGVIVIMFFRVINEPIRS